MAHRDVQQTKLFSSLFCCSALRGLVSQLCVMESGGDVLISKWLYDPSPEKQNRRHFNPRINHGPQLWAFVSATSSEVRAKIGITIAINCTGVVFCCFCLSFRHTLKTIHLNTAIVRTLYERPAVFFDTNCIPKKIMMA